MKLTPITALGKEEAKKIKTIIQFILDKPESYEFQFPVDWKSTQVDMQPWGLLTIHSSSRIRWIWGRSMKNSAPRNTDL